MFKLEIFDKGVTFLLVDEVSAQGHFKDWGHEGVGELRGPGCDIVTGVELLVVDFLRHAAVQRVIYPVDRVGGHADQTLSVEFFVADYLGQGGLRLDGELFKDVARMNIGKKYSSTVYVINFKKINRIFPCKFNFFFESSGLFPSVKK